MPSASTFLAEEGDLDQATVATARSLATVLPPSVDYHLKVLPAPHTGESYRRAWQSINSVRSPKPSSTSNLAPTALNSTPQPGDTNANSSFSGSVYLKNQENTGPSGTSI